MWLSITSQCLFLHFVVEQFWNLSSKDVLSFLCRTMWNPGNTNDQTGQVAARMETTPSLGSASISISTQQAPKKFAPVVAPKPKFNPYKQTGEPTHSDTAGNLAGPTACYHYETHSSPQTAVLLLALCMHLHLCPVFVSSHSTSKMSVISVRFYISCSQNGALTCRFL